MNSGNPEQYPAEFKSNAVDLADRHVVRWAMGQHMHDESVEQALEMAVSRHRPASGILHYIDRDRGMQSAPTAACSRPIE